MLLSDNIANSFFYRRFPLFAQFLPDTSGYWWGMTPDADNFATTKVLSSDISLVDIVLDSGDTKPWPL